MSFVHYQYFYLNTFFSVWLLIIYEHFSLWFIVLKLYFLIFMEKDSQILPLCFFLNFSISPLPPQPKFSHLYLFLLSRQGLQPVGKVASKQRFTQRVRTWKNTWLVHAQASFLWQCYTGDYCQTQRHIDQRAGEEPLESAEIICGLV